jgi:hypothetical protein
MGLSRLAVIACLLSWSAWAQEFRATITGHVTDPAGAVVPQATVQATNVATNEIAVAKTNDQGTYTLPLLKPGTYRLTAEARGFKKYIRDNIVLNVGDVSGIDIGMEVGQASESITVTAETPVLETETADHGLVIDQKRVTELPLNARNPFMLSILSAGVNFNGNQIYQRPFDNGAIADWSVNGGLDRKNEFLLDGAPNNAQAGGNNIAYVPPVDAVQEFKIQTNSYDAQYGKSAGGIVNVSLKSGTNAFHGTLYEFMRRNAFDANSFQNNAAGKPKSGHFLDQYGGSIGGPILVPKIYNGHDKIERLQDVFGLTLPDCQPYRWKRYMTAFYGNLYAEILRSILDSPVIHIDETTVRLRKQSGYVWVMTSIDKVYYFYRSSREGSFLQELLKTFSGVLVSDFYTAYDSVKCHQQKCLVHLVRDIDDDVMKNPLDTELKSMAQQFGVLLRTIIETVNHRGLKSRYLRKHKHSVLQFLESVSSGDFLSPLASRYKKRFQRSGEKMFTFLDHDGVPWNNNNAEHAIKRFAKYRRDADGRFTKRTLEEYLVLATVFETCEFNNVNALKFLLSKQTTLEGLLQMAGT